MKYTAEELSRSTLEKTVDSFYVKFLNFENNRANILGKNVYSLERPALTFNTYETKHKQEKMTNNAQLIFQPFNIVFRDDDLNLTSKVIYEQLYRQTGVVNAVRSDHTFDKAKFDIQVQVYTSNKQPVEVFVMKGCFITGLSHSTNIYTNADPNRITVSVQCDTVDYEFTDDYFYGDSTVATTGQLP